MYIRNLLCMTLFCLSLDLFAADAEPITLATESAEAWLELVDDGKYGESWDAGSTLLQTATTRDAWENVNMERMRAPYRLASRRMGTPQITTSFQGLPGGEYVVLKYASKFRPARRNLKSRDISSSGPTEMVETVVLGKEADGAWKVSFYMMSPGVLRPANP